MLASLGRILGRASPDVLAALEASPRVSRAATYLLHQLEGGSMLGGTASLLTSLPDDVLILICREMLTTREMVLLDRTCVFFHGEARRHSCMPGIIESAVLSYSTNGMSRDHGAGCFPPACVTASSLWSQRITLPSWPRLLSSLSLKRRMYGQRKTLTAAYHHSLALIHPGPHDKDKSVCDAGGGGSVSNESESRGGQVYSWGCHSVEGAGDGDSVLGRGVKEGGVGSSTPVLITQWNHHSTCRGSTAVKAPAYSSCIIDVSSRDVHNLSVTATGEVWVWGAGDNGRLGLGGQGQDREDSRSVAVPTRLTCFGTYGGGGTGRLSNPAVSLSMRAGQSVLPASSSCLPIILSVSAGDNHSMALSDGGVVYTWGYGHEGALGHGNRDSLYEPKAVAGLSESAGGGGGCVPFKVCMISAGSDHSMALRCGVMTEERGGRESGIGSSHHQFPVYAWGKGSHGQLGGGQQGHGLPAARQVGKLGYNIHDTTVPRPVRTDNGEGSGLEREGVTAIAAGAACSYLITPCTGSVWSFGRSNYGQLGLGDSLRQFNPVQITNWIRGTGGGGTGYMTEGGLGRGQTDTSYPALPPTPVITSISAGWTHTLFVTSVGTVFSCGQGEWGKLGHGDEEDVMGGPTLIEGLLRDSDGARLFITEASAGVTHSLVRGRRVVGTDQGAGRSDPLCQRDAASLRYGEEVVLGFGHADDGSLGVGVLYQPGSCHALGAQCLPIKLALKPAGF